MPLTERDPNISGRNSRASGTSSAHTRDSAKRNGGKSDPLSSTPGVMSMLRNTTEIGDVGSLALPPRSNRYGQSAHRSSGRTSASSTHSGSTRPRTNHHAWPSASSAPRRSITSNLTVLDQLLHKSVGIRDGPLAMPTALHPTQDGRSYSLTNDMALHPHVLAHHHSLTSLRMHETQARPRSPFIYPTRLKRPGYRSPSPALSDITGMHLTRPPPIARPGSALRALHPPPLPQAKEALRLPFPPNHNALAPSTHRHPSSAGGHRPSRLPPPLYASSNAPPIVAPAPLRVRQPALRITPSPTSNHMRSSEFSASPDTPDHTASSMEVSVSPSYNTDPTSVVQVSATISQLDDRPAYYDYSESFQSRRALPNAVTRPIASRSPPTVPDGFVHRIRSLLEECVGDDSSTTFAAQTSTPVGTIAELPGDGSVAELPAEDVSEAIRRMRQAQAAHATVHAENVTMESIAQLITDVREQQEPDETPKSSTESLARSTNTGQVNGTHTTKRLSVISEAASNTTKSTSNSAAIDFAIRYSVAVSVPSSDSHSLLPAPEESAEHNQTDNKNDKNDDDGAKANTEQDDTPRPSTEFNGEEASTGSIKVATEVVFERRREALSLLQPRSTPDRPKSMNVLTSSPTNPSSRYSAPTERTTWFNGDSDATSSDATPSDIAVRISIPSMRVASIEAPKSTIASNADNIETSTSDEPTTTVEVEPPVVVQITESTDTIKTIPPVSPMAQDPILSHRDSPVSPINSITVKRPAPIQLNLVQVVDTPSNQPVSKETASKICHRAQQSTSNRTDSSSGTIKDVLAQYSEPPEMSTTDLRFSQLRHPAVIKKPLPDLKEEPNEDSSRTDFRISDFKFPLPGRNRRASFDSATGRMSKDATRTGRASVPARTYSNALAEIRSIPSLHFSSINLVDKLNNALGHQSTGSLEALNLEEHISARPTTSDMRERYRSFFAGLDELDRGAVESGADEPLPHSDEELDGGATEPSSEIQRTPEEALEELIQKAQTPKEPQRPTIHMIQRPISPLDIIEEVNRLTVPNINGLTQRLSDMIPSLKRFYMDEDITEEATVELTLNEIRGLGRRRIVRADGRVISLVKEDSWVVPEDLQLDSPDVFSTGDLDSKVKRDSAVATTTSSKENLNEAAVDKRTSGATVATSSAKSSETPNADPSEALAAVQRPAPVITRGRSMTDSYGVVRSSSKLHLDSHTSLKSLVVIHPPRSSSFDVRPWNFDDAYPWATTNIDISFPAPTFQRDSPKPGPSKLRNSESNAKGDDDSDNESTIKGENTDNNITTEDNTRSTEDTFSNRRSSRRSVFGSVTRRIGNTLSSTNKHGNPAVNITAATTSLSFDNAGFPLSADLLRLREDERVVDPGDRYPTTGLSPPNTFNLDDVRSFFSDDSSIRNSGAKDGLGITKRFTRLRMGMTRAASAMDNRHLRPTDALDNDDHSPHNSRRLGGVRSAASARNDRCPHSRHGERDDAMDGAVSPSLTTGYDGSTVHGMGKTEFRARKVIDKIKVLWYKSGELIRTLSGKTKRDSGDKNGLGWGVVQERNVGVDESEMYSGT